MTKHIPCLNLFNPTEMLDTKVAGNTNILLQCIVLKAIKKCLM